MSLSDEESQQSYTIDMPGVSPPHPCSTFKQEPQLMENEQMDNAYT